MLIKTGFDSQNQTVKPWFFVQRFATKYLVIFLFMSSNSTAAAHKGDSWSKNAILSSEVLSIRRQTLLNGFTGLPNFIGFSGLYLECTCTAQTWHNVWSIEQLYLKLLTIQEAVQGHTFCCALRLWQSSTVQMKSLLRVAIRIARAALLHGSKLVGALSNMIDNCQNPKSRAVKYV